MSGALSRVFSAVTDYNKTMTQFHGSYIGLERKTLSGNREIASDLSSEQHREALALFALATLCAVLKVAVAVSTPAADPAQGNQNNPRLGANDGLSDFFKRGTEWLHANKGTVEPLADFSGKAMDPARVWYDSEITQLRSKQELVQILLRDEQQARSYFGQEPSRIQEKVLSIIQSKSKGG